MISIVLSGLALLAAAGCFCLIYQERKRNEKRNAASLREEKDAAKRLVEFVSEMLRGYVSETIDGNLEDIRKRVQSLEQGCCPDYEEAKAAAKAVNDFNVGLSAIMNFDPMAEAKKARERTRYGEAE